MSIDPFIERLYELKPFKQIPKMILNQMYLKFLKRARQEALPDPMTTVQEAFDKVDRSFNYWDTVAELEMPEYIGIRYEYEKIKEDPYLAFHMQTLRDEARELGMELIESRDVRRLEKARDRLEEVERQLKHLKAEKERFERERRKPPPGGITPEQAERLVSEFISKMEEAGIPEDVYSPEIEVVKAMIKTEEDWETNKKKVYGYAETFITEYRKIKPPVKPPTVLPPTPPVAPPPPLGVERPRMIRRFDWLTGKEYYTYDDDLLRRIQERIYTTPAIVTRGIPPESWWGSSFETQKKVWGYNLIDYFYNLLVEDLLSMDTIYGFVLPDEWLTELSDRYEKYKAELRRIKEERLKGIEEEVVGEYDKYGVWIGWKRKKK